MLMIEAILMSAFGISAIAFIGLAVAAKGGTGLKSVAADRLQPDTVAAPRRASIKVQRSGQICDRLDAANAADGDGRDDQQRFSKAA